MKTDEAQTCEGAANRISELKNVIAIIQAVEAILLAIPPSIALWRIQQTNLEWPSNPSGQYIKLFTKYYPNPRVTVDMDSDMRNFYLSEFQQ